ACFVAPAVRAQPYIASVVPTNGAIGVSISAPVVFTFSEPMETNLTSALFGDIYASQPVFYPVSNFWNIAGTVLTCTPTPPFPTSTLINWYVDGQNPASDSLSDTGSFVTSASTAGAGTNRISTFTIGKVHSYTQLMTNAPALDPVPYFFLATTTLA